MPETPHAPVCAPPLFAPACAGRQAASACCVVLDSITDGVFAVDREQRVVSFFNRAAERITGFSAEEALGRHCFEVFRSRDCQTRCPVERTMTDGESVVDFPSVIITKAGVEVPVSIAAAPIRDERGAVVGAVEIFRDLSVIETLREGVSGRYRLGGLLSKSPRMQDVFEILPEVAESDSTVLIQGPSGSGKEVVAAAIHDLSHRKDQPFVKINCGAIPDTLLESELFGYVKGAFTDARRDKPGRFVAANHGTLFLDEIGDMSPALQVKLLRVLEERQFVPLGGTAPVHVNVRIIAASHKDIEQLVEAGSFRDDLYYRLNIIKIELPPLWERREDIPLLVEHLLSRLRSIKEKSVSGVSAEVMDLLLNYRFPGNVRELENILEHAYVLCKGPIIEKKNLPLDFLKKAERGSSAASPATLVESAEARTIQDVLRRHNGSRVAAARELGVSRSTLWRKIRKFHLA
ncbi:MAG: sigma-54 interaction domain-containing protein [Candidatus Methylomirabilales bacterium]